jgi:hypothetical protein
MSSTAPKPRVKLPPPRGQETEVKLCQAVVPVVLLDAARKEWKERGLSARQVMTWALMEYLTAVNPKKAQKVGKKIHDGI